MLCQVAAAWRREKKIKAKKRAPVGQGIALQPALHASEGMQAALNGTVAKPTAQAVSRKQLNRLLNEVCICLLSIYLHHVSSHHVCNHVMIISFDD